MMWKSFQVRKDITSAKMEVALGIYELVLRACEHWNCRRDSAQDTQRRIWETRTSSLEPRPQGLADCCS